ncbi:hypothetical protein [Vibrio sp. SCSIO 43137]|uniref:CdiA C-terminal domain-containing protein n=1 Tax=Vibrio sp. SCSIO 43137 TaxID=3021011 RepID=UPI002307D66C|nr:hypothetical protein [Vibrio sp. SCSIO 43137]WCE32088.1 hypothetical protein PK654_16405 [Vibrio sp. SCSIO 43137]
MALDSENSDDTTSLNRDTEHTEKDLFTVDRKQGDFDVTIDHRLLTEEGRNQIAEDVLITDMFRESLERAITTERVGITDFFDETGKQLSVYNAVKQSIADDPSLAAKLQDPDLPAEAKEQMLDQLTHAAIKSLGYDAEGYDNKIIAKDDDVRQGFYSEETGDSYINDHNIYDTEGLVNVAGHEMSHAIDDQSGDVNKYSEQDREIYAENIGSDFVDYTDTALDVNGHGSMASTNSHVGNSGKTVSNNNAVFDQLDKNNGDNAIPLIVVAGLALELIDKGITAYEAYKLEEALSEGRMDEAKELATDLGVGLATEAIPGNKIAIKVVGAVKDVVKGADKADTVKDLNQMSKIGDEVKESTTSGIKELPTDNVIENGTALNPKKGSLRGEPETPPANANPDMIRAIDRQNESAELLANHGLEIEHLPNTGKKGGNPDISIGGRPADVYSPKSKNPNTIWDNMTYKVGHQAPDIVLNISDSPLSSSDILKFLNEKPVDGLKELYIIDGKDVILKRF